MIDTYQGQDGIADLSPKQRKQSHSTEERKSEWQNSKGDNPKGDSNNNNNTNNSNSDNPEPISFALFT